VARTAAATILFHHRRPVRAITVQRSSHGYSQDMRRKLKRYYGAGDLHFITCSCYQRRPLLGTPQRRNLFLSVLEQMRIRYQFVVVGYVIMPEHIHLLIGEPQEKNPSTVMQALKLGFARRVLAPKRRANTAQTDLFDNAPRHIWQRRFYDFNVWTEHKRVEKLRYMHRNPVHRGLVESPELWRWSSYRAYFLGETGPVRINEWEVLKMKMRTPAA
jgi:putative transposase